MLPPSTNYAILYNPFWGKVSDTITYPKEVLNSFLRFLNFDDQETVFKGFSKSFIVVWERADTTTPNCKAESKIVHV